MSAWMRHRARWVAAAAIGAAAAAAVVALPTGAHQSTRQVARSSTSPGGGSTIVLAGYRVTLPANYKTGVGDTNCTSDLHLSPDEQQRLITTPAGGCPLLITSVRRDPPVAAEPGSYGVCAGKDGLRVAPYTALAARGAHGEQLYFPTKLPDSSTVYVTIDWWAGRRSPGLGPTCETLSAQIAALAQGIAITPTS